MALFDKMKDSISVASQGVSQKAKTATESMRLSNQMKANERMIEKLTNQVGAQCVRNHVNEAGTEYDALFSEILRLRRENQGLQAELQALSVGNVCPKCGFGNNPGSKFCISCGSPLNMNVNTAPVGGKTCVHCGVVNAEDALFCVECGKRFEAPAPAAVAPTVPVSEGSVTPMAAKPVTPVVEELVAPVSEEPVTPVVEESVTPVVEEPAAPVSEEPAAAEPAAPVVEEPVIPVSEEPVTPVVEEPVTPAAVEPVMPEAPAVPRCKNCGAMLEEDALFCVQCGTRRDDV